MKTFKKVFILAVLLTVSAITAVTAQVTIGANQAPQDFSILELVSGGNKGLRLPQLDSLQRKALQATFGSKATAEAMGMQIFNTDTYCVETWNGQTWIAACMDCTGVTFPAINGHYDFCFGADVSALTARVGGNVSWYNSALNGSLHLPAAPLVAGTY